MAAPSPSSRPRVLVVTRNLPPLRGGMERLNFHLLKELSTAFEVHVCCPRDCIAQLPDGIGATALPLRPLSRFVLSSTLAAVAVARRFRPQLVLAGSGLTAPMARIAARLAGARSAAYLHGLDIVAQNRAYQRLWVPSFRGLDAAFVNSRHTAGLAAQAGVAPKKIHILHPGVELPPWETQRGDAFRLAFGLGDRPILLSLGRLTARKGLTEFLEHAMPALAAADPRLLLVVIGAEAVDSIKTDAQSQLSRIQAAVQRLGLQSQVRLLGAQDDATVQGALFAARALVFPVIELAGDTEGFGMVAVEAAAHGTPTIAFAVGGITDAVREGVSGALIKAGDYQALTYALNKVSEDFGQRTVREQCRAFAAEFRWEMFGARLKSLIHNLLAASA